MEITEASTGDIQDTVKGKIHLAGIEDEREGHREKEGSRDNI